MIDPMVLQNLNLLNLLIYASAVLCLNIMTLDNDTFFE